MSDYSHNNWRGTTDGTPFMQRALVALCKVFPLWLIYGIVALVIPFYMLFDRKGYRASRNFFKRLGYKGLKVLDHVYKNEFNLGMVVVDRFAMYAGKQFDIDCSGEGPLVRRMDSDEGLVLLSCHFGNFELGGYSVPARKRLNALVFAGEKAAVMNGRAKLFANTNVRMIPVGDDLSHLFTMMDALSAGEIVSMPGDRVYGSSKTLRCPFLGGEVLLPSGPYTLAAKRNVPIVGMVILKSGLRSYKVFSKELEGRTAVQKAAAAAAALEPLVRQYPDQWYNFFDMWNNPVTDVNPADVDIHLILPQREPFLFCDSLLTFDENTSVTEFAIPSEGLFIENGCLRADALVEVMAQAAAARIGFKAKYIDKESIRIGMIGSVKKLTIHRLPGSGEILRTKITILHDVFGISLADAEITAKNGPVASAQLKIALTDREMTA